MFKDGDKVVFVVYDKRWDYVPEVGKVYTIYKYDQVFFKIPMDGGEPVFRPDMFRLATLLEIELQS